MKILLLLLIIVTSCQKKEVEPIENEELTHAEATDGQIMVLPDVAPSVLEDKLSNIIDFKLGDPITLDSPKRFIQITILFTIEQSLYYNKVLENTSITENELNANLEKSRNDFYKKLGISENDYIQYSINNSEQIQEFLSTNQDFAEAYDLSLGQVTH